MQHQNRESAISGPISLLKHYSFESNGQSYEKVLNSWLERFPLSWVNLALVESLHQGRYKVVSVEQILTLWQRRGKPSYHFNHDFERLVSNNLPRKFEGKSSSMSAQKRSSRFLNRKSRYDALNSSPSTPLLSYLSQPHPPRDEEYLPQEPPSHHQWADESKTIGLLPSEPVWTPDRRPALAASKVIGPSHAEKTIDGDETAVHAVNMESGTQPDPVQASDRGKRSELDAVSEQQAAPEDSEQQLSVSPSSGTGETFNPIHQFVPQSATSVFYSKLTAMAQINV